MLARSTSLLLLVSLLLWADVARASEPAAAEALFDEAKRLMSQRRYAEACEKFAASQTLDAGLGTQFHLADCWQHIGRKASAWALFREVESQARAVGQVGRQRVAHDRAEALEPWLSKMVIAPHGASATPGLEIHRDGAEIVREQWDVPVPVDEGSHVVSVIAPHKAQWQTTVDIPPDGKTLTVDVPPLADVPDVPVAQTAPPAQPGTAPRASSRMGVTSAMPASVAETPVVENRGSTQRALGWFFVGGGVAGVAAGLYFGTRWLDDKNSADRHCRGGTCDAIGANLRSEARTQGRYAEATLGAGAGALLVGAVLAATAPRPRIVVSTVSLAIAPVIGAGHGGLVIRGLW
jgi:hypothetical protein